MTRDSENITKHRNIHIMGVPEDEGREKDGNDIWRNNGRKLPPEWWKKLIHIPKNLNEVQAG